MPRRECCYSPARKCTILENKLLGGCVSCRPPFAIAVLLGVLIPLVLPSAVAQDEPVTAEQVIARYFAAVGADKFASINTFMEIGDLHGNLPEFGQSRSSTSGTFERYFKRPNLRFSSSLTERRTVLSFDGCN